MDRNLPEPYTQDTPLPTRYEAAKTALAECARVDECKEWADRAAALKSYARQADDDSLYQTAIRIQSRAIRRAGELLREFQAKNQHEASARAGDGPSSQREAAEQAGMSKRQEKTARRIAEIPEQEFEELVDSDDPPSVTELAEKGRKVMTGWSSPTMGMARWWEHTLRDALHRIETDSPADVAAGLLPANREATAHRARQLVEWLESLIEELGE